MSEIFGLYLRLFQYLDENILWTNRVLFVVSIICLVLFFLKFKNIKNLFFLMLFSFTLLINIVRFNPVMEDFSEFYNIQTTDLSGIGFFSHNDFEGIKYITTPIGYESINEEGVNYIYIDEETIREFSNNKSDWNFPHPNFVKSLSNFLKSFNSFTCELKKENAEYFNIKITDSSNTYNYCFINYE